VYICARKKRKQKLAVHIKMIETSERTAVSTSYVSFFPITLSIVELTLRYIIYTWKDGAEENADAWPEVCARPGRLQVFTSHFARRCVCVDDVETKKTAHRYVKQTFIEIMSVTIQCIVNVCNIQGEYKTVTPCYFCWYLSSACEFLQETLHNC